MKTIKKSEKLKTLRFFLRFLHIVRASKFFCMWASPLNAALQLTGATTTAADIVEKFRIVVATTRLESNLEHKSTKFNYTHPNKNKNFMQSAQIYCNKVGKNK